MLRFVCLSTFLLAVALAADVRSGFYRGHKVSFENVNGDAVYQGDIILGRTADLESVAASSKSRESIGVWLTFSLWPNGVIPYEISSGVPTYAVDEINQAVDHWNTLTPIKWVKHSGETSYVLFRNGTSANTCSSAVGRQGYGQAINLPPASGCGFGSTVHEMGHAVGLWHEQSRSDRNRSLTVLYQNIDRSMSYNFDQELSNAVDLGTYDFNSIMHYGPYDFSIDGSPAMESVPAGIPMGQREGLSAGDIDAVQRLYGQTPTKTVVTTNPSGLRLVVDGQEVADRTSFDWGPGSTHTVEAPQQGSDSIRYVFGRWSDGGAASHVFTASPDRTVLLADFVQQFKVDLQVTPDGAGTITLDPPSPDAFYTDRTNVLITANPAQGFNFVDWSARPSRSLNPKWIAIGPDATWSTLTATFTADPVTTITSDPIGQLIYSDDVPYTTPVNLAWKKDEKHTLAIDTTTGDFIHYRFEDWSDGGDATHTVTATGGMDTIVARYTPQYLVTVRWVGGSILENPLSPDGFYDKGTNVTLTATPRQGAVLLGWYGDLIGDANPATLTIDSEKYVTAVFGTAPPFTITSAASFDDQTVSPGDIVAIFSKTKIGPSTGTAGQVVNGRVATQVAGVQVLFDGIPAPILYAGEKQVNCVVPYAINGYASSIQILNDGNAVSTSPVRMPTATSRPAVFTADGSGRKGAAALNEDLTPNSPDNPAARGSVVVLYATGGGALDQKVDDGQVNTSSFPKTALPIGVRIGGFPAEILYAGSAPYLVAGALQINARVPLNVKAGPGVPLSLVVGDEISMTGVTLAIR